MWLEPIRLFFYWGVPVILILVLASKRIMRIRYSLAIWIVWLIGDKYLMAWIPVPTQMWPPSFQLVISLILTVAVLMVIIGVTVWIYLRSERGKWLGSYPRGTNRDILPWLESKPPQNLREFLTLILQQVGVFYQRLTKSSKIHRM